MTQSLDDDAGDSEPVSVDTEEARERLAKGTHKRVPDFPLIVEPPFNASHRAISRAMPKHCNDIYMKNEGGDRARPQSNKVKSTRAYIALQMTSKLIQSNQKFQHTYPVAEIVGEGDVSRERVGECRVEVKDFEQPVALDDVKVTVGQRSHVRRRLADRLDLPEQIPEHVAFA